MKNERSIDKTENKTAAANQFHTHRALIGFDEHGIPKMLVKAEGEKHTHTAADGTIYEHFHEAEFTDDYNRAVAEYRKTFPSKQDVLDKTADPAVRQMMLNMEQIGLDTAFDRFDRQKPQCGFGLSGSCCKICNMGPCRITPKSPKDVCGADADLVVARQLLRSLCKTELKLINGIRAKCLNREQAAVPGLLLTGNGYGRIVSP